MAMGTGVTGGVGGNSDIHVMKTFWKRTASSPKFRPKKRKAAADAMAYDHVAALAKAQCAGTRAVATDGRPIRKNARPKKIQGADRTYTDGLSLNNGYQTADAARNTPPRT